MKKVVIYTLSTCPWCKKTKQFFTEKNIPFESTDYDLVSQIEQERILLEMQKYGARAFPFVKIGDAVVVGYYPDRYIELLNK